MTGTLAGHATVRVPEDGFAALANAFKLPLVHAQTFWTTQSSALRATMKAFPVVDAAFASIAFHSNASMENGSVAKSLVQKKPAVPSMVKLTIATPMTNAQTNVHLENLIPALPITHALTTFALHKVHSSSPNGTSLSKRLNACDMQSRPLL